MTNRAALETEKRAETEPSGYELCAPTDFFVKKGVSGDFQLYYKSIDGMETLLCSASTFLSTKPNEERLKAGDGVVDTMYSVSFGNTKYVFGDIQVIYGGNGKENRLIFSKSHYEAALLSVAQQLYDCAGEDKLKKNGQELVENIASKRGKIKTLIKARFHKKKPFNGRIKKPKTFEQVEQFTTQLLEFEQQQIVDALKTDVFVDDGALVEVDGQQQENYLGLGSRAGVHIVLSETVVKFIDDRPDDQKKNIDKPFLYTIAPVKIILTNQPDLVAAQMRETSLLGHVFVVYSPFAREQSEYTFNPIMGLDEVNDFLKTSDLPIKLHKNTDRFSPFKIAISPDYASLNPLTISESSFLESANPIALQAAILGELDRLKKIIGLQYSQRLSHDKNRHRRDRATIFEFQVMTGITLAMIIGIALLAPPEQFYLVGGIFGAISATALPSLEAFKHLLKRKIDKEGQGDIQKLAAWEQSIKLLELLSVIAEKAALQKLEPETTQTAQTVDFLAAQEQRRRRLSHENLSSEASSFTGASDPHSQEIELGE